MFKDDFPNLFGVFPIIASSTEDGKAFFRDIEGKREPLSDFIGLFHKDTFEDAHKKYHAQGI